MEVILSAYEQHDANFQKLLEELAKEADPTRRMVVMKTMAQISDQIMRLRSKSIRR